GPVSNLALWPQWLLASVLLMLATLTLAGRPASRRAALLLPLLAALGAGSLGLWGELMRTNARFVGEWLWAGALAGLNLLVLAHGALALARPDGWRQRLFTWLEAHAGTWLLAAGFAAAVSMLAMVFDPRYRSFPSAALLLPAVVYLLRPVPARRAEVALLAFIVGAGVAPQLFQEGLANRQAWGWAVVSVLMAGALWRSLKLRLA
ncbi:MAG: beta (1-6) glucans synthase, partial [Pseudomonas sp.]|nr:beta (1-6) glucans synthase [Pseudomonas sp.]